MQLRLPKREAHRQQRTLKPRSLILTVLHCLRRAADELDYLFLALRWRHFCNGRAEKSRCRHFLLGGPASTEKRFYPT